MNLKNGQRGKGLLLLFVLAAVVILGLYLYTNKDSGASGGQSNAPEIKRNEVIDE